MDEKENNEKKTITISVNLNPVAFTEHTVTGLQIKEAAINQGVNIQLDFNLFEVKEGKLKPIPDSKSLEIHKDEIFKAVTPDDNS